MMFTIESSSPILQYTKLHRFPAAVSFSGISIDSRTIRGNEMFIAIKGPSFDGNEYAQSAVARGAAVVVVNRAIPELEAPTIEVHDSIDFLRRLAIYVRSKCRGRFVAVTGSFGKTTTKDMLAAALSLRYNTYCTKRSLNNYIGLPLTIANNPIDSEYSVIELGMSAPNEIFDKASIVQPDIAVVTSAGLMHPEKFLEPQGIAFAKSEIFDHLGDCGIAMVCSSGSLSSIVIDNARHHPKVKHLFTYGCLESDDIRIVNTVLSEPGLLTAQVKVFGEDILYTMPTLSKAAVVNSLAALGLAYLLKIDMPAVINAMSEFVALEGRGKIVTHKICDKTIHIIDDTHNAGPDSIANGVAMLHNMAQYNRGRKIAVLGYLVDLGCFRRNAYQAVAECLKDVDVVYTVGIDVAQDMPNAKVRKSFETPEAAAEFLLNDLADGDNILIKGSRASRMEKAMDMLMASV